MKRKREHLHCDQSLRFTIRTDIVLGQNNVLYVFTGGENILLTATSAAGAPPVPDPVLIHPRLA
jgi:hypothetical protein